MKMKLSAKILKEAETPEKVDKNQMVQDLAEVQSNLASSFALLYAYKDQVIPNANWKAALSSMRGGISGLMTKLAATINMIGIEGEIPKEL